MNKPTCVFYGAVDVYSGYSARSRDLVRALIELKGEEWDIKIISCRWGSCPKGFIQDNPEWQFLNDYIIEGTQLPTQPDYMIWNTIPSEAQVVGKYNILITAGIESTIAPADWIEGCQRMDLVLGSSKHTIDVLRSSKFEKRDQKTNQPMGVVEWTKPGDTLLEGADTNKYNPLNKVDFDLSNVKEDFAYLFVGHYMNGDIGEDRKNVSLLIKAFYETFKNQKNKPALILKTTAVGSSYTDRNEIIRRIKLIKNTCKSLNLPNVYLVHGDFTDEEMNELYNHSKVKAMVSLTKGEGWGRPLLEFSLTNKPIITTNWSGHLDYLKPEFTTLLPGNLTPIHPSAANNMLMKEASWFSVDHGSVGNKLKDVYENYKTYAELGKRQGYYSRTNFSFENMKEKFSGILNNIPEFARQVIMKLPTLEKKKITLPKLQKL